MMPDKKVRQSTTVMLVFGTTMFLSACGSSPEQASPQQDVECGTAALYSYSTDAEGYASPEEAIKALSDFLADTADDDSGTEEAVADRRAMAAAAAALAADPQQGPGTSYEARDEGGAYVARALFVEAGSGGVNIGTFMYPSLLNGCDDLGAYTP